MNKLQGKKKPQKEAIVFSSEDSLNTDNSFNSSIEEDNFNDYKNTFFNLKEQMNQFFAINPDLQDQLKQEIKKRNFSDDDDEDLNDQQLNTQQSGKLKTQPSQQNQQQEEQQPIIEKKTQKKEKIQGNKLWSAISKDVVRNGQFSSKVPTLETVNHRINIFKAKIDKIDYMDILQKELNKQQNVQLGKSGSEKQKKDKDQEKEKDGSQSPKNKDSIILPQQEEESPAPPNLDGDIEYYSFKKKMQVALREKQERLKAIHDAKIFGRRPNLQTRGYNSAERMKNVKIGPRGTIRFNLEDDNENNEDNQNQNTQNSKSDREFENQMLQLQDKSMEFQTKIGQALFQTLQQAGGDKESFKKTANFILRDYNKIKMNTLKNKNFPPQIQKFTNDETKHLNMLLPDFQNPLYAPNKTNLFMGIEHYKLPEGTPESDFLNVVDKVIDGKVLAFWKSLQNNN